ncbi:uncharacterized protein EDB93DRAFT_1243278 [Suillus bovinus]|uniref:uncharacterized protein n=1 Tax=Suillus bovinus TaxID=48563 RepID=UPI001B8733D2|nr:uncharacterized protein EDB93DRAFT_1243278 [Suillus bovinus]KAG2130405.1 hypothetical protein EDB93DRAFT_1243278 [Suillus bovinus]
MCMVHKWQHLKQLWHAGRGHDTGGIKATTTGELALQCPACPHPGKNLPEGWENKLLWKYVLFIAINTNFRLKCKAVSSDNVDPSLNSGWAYFVQEADYKTYLAHQAGVKQDHSTCVSHNAVNLADMKSSHGLATTSVGTVHCARHDMKLANSVRDLQKGEKYINMDYLVFSALLAFTVTMINISYDIACQWHKKLWTHMEGMPSRFHIPHNSMTIRFFVPKFHLKAHIDASPEHGWSNINRVATSTKEMGPGSRRDTLDDYFGDWNWKKVMALGCMLLRKIRDAVKWKKEHGEGLAELERTVQPALILQWRKEVEAWEADNSQPNPFKSRYASITQAAVHLQLAELEAHELQAGINVSLHTDISPSRLITTGIDLQDQQQHLKTDITNVSLHPTNKQKATMQTHITTLQHRLDAWAHVQELYMLIVSQLHHRSSDAGVMPHRLAEHEWDLCHAQALDALNEVRSHLHLRSHMYIYKDQNVCGQAASTHAQALIEGVEQRKCASVDKYWHASVRVEWCKACARANRWSEEVELLLKEMRRVIVSLRWQAEWWSGTISVYTYVFLDGYYDSPPAFHIA